MTGATRDPDVCPKGHQETHVIRRWRARGHLGRRHACYLCGERWTSYQTLIDPRTIHRRQRVLRAAMRD
jgi:transcriptional regulator NrdR family protein